MSRLLVRCSIMTSPQKRYNQVSDNLGQGVDIFFPATADGSFISKTSSSKDGDDVTRIVRDSIATVCERTFDKAQDAMLALLSKIDDVGVVRRCLGILAEV